MQLIKTILMNIKNQTLKLVTTSDGSYTLFVPELNEHYHSVFGAVQESEYIFIGCGFDFCRKNPVRIFEAGFGTGLNALLTCKRNEDKKNVIYTSLELHPLSAEVTDKLNYPDIIKGNYNPVFRRIHSCNWGRPEIISPGFTLHKIQGDLITMEIEGKYDIIYFDAFGPDKQPEMWSDEVFRKMSDIAGEECVFVTYSAKGEVRRRLNRVGFDVDLLPGPPGKRQIIRAIKK